MTDYEDQYHRCDSACGEPFAEFVSFFESAERGLRVLDLGCGQGRDALMAARCGHHVHGVDQAPTGNAQMTARALADGLDATGEVADVETYETDREYDVVLLDRVLHMLPSDERRIALLDKVRRWVRPGGHALVADSRSPRALIRDYFAHLAWESVLKKKDYLSVQRP